MDRIWGAKWFATFKVFFVCLVSICFLVSKPLWNQNFLKIEYQLPISLLFHSECDIEESQCNCVYTRNITYVHISLMHTQRRLQTFMEVCAFFRVPRFFLKFKIQRNRCMNVCVVEKIRGLNDGWNFPSTSLFTRGLEWLGLVWGQIWVLGIQ